MTSGIFQGQLALARSRSSVKNDNRWSRKIRELPPNCRELVLPADNAAALSGNIVPEAPRGRRRRRMVATQIERACIDVAADNDLGARLNVD